MARVFGALGASALVAVTSCGGRSQTSASDPQGAAGVGRGSAGAPASDALDASVPDSAAPSAGAASLPSAGASSVADAGGVADAGKSAGGAGPSPALTELEAYAAFQLEADRIRQTRFAECFNETGPDLAPEDDHQIAPNEVYVGPSLRAGTAFFDEGQANGCLDSLRSIPCSVLATTLLFIDPGKSQGDVTVCDRVLRGRVPRGGVCLTNVDCEDPDTDACTSPDGSTNRCDRRCTRRPDLGQPCAGNCGTGNLCLPRNGSAECAPTPGLDAPCYSSDTCRTGLYCRYRIAGVLEGTCRPLAVGAACAWTWECPFPYVCDGGACQVGRAVNQPCEVEPQEAWISKGDNCAPTLGCYASGSGALTCHAGQALGEACDGNLFCAEGYCSLPPPEEARRCVLYKKAGEGCQPGEQCEDPLTCQAGVCALLARELGAQCGFNDLCAGDAYCDIVDNPWDDATGEPNPPFGHCRAARRAGESCISDYTCEPLSNCVAGRCQACAPAP